MKRVMSINLHRVLKNRRFYKYSSKTFLSDRKLESFSIKMQFNTFLSCFDQTMSNVNIDIRHLLILINKQFWTMLSNSVSFRFWLAKIIYNKKINLQLIWHFRFHRIEKQNVNTDVFRGFTFIIQTIKKINNCQWTFYWLFQLNKFRQLVFSIMFCMRVPTKLNKNE